MNFEVTMGRSNDGSNPGQILGQSNRQADAESLQHEELSTGTESKPQFNNGSNHNGSHVDDVAKGKEKDEPPGGGNSKKDAPAAGSVPFFRLFAFADPMDYLLLTIGTVAAVAHGAALPVFFLFFGNLIDGFGSTESNPAKTADEVNKVTTRIGFN